MKLETIKPNITQYFFRFTANEDEAIHSRCMWARINLDHDSYTMTATSDCGDYLYSWCCTPDTESFVELMARIGYSYLLNKISSRSEFNIKKSKAKTIANLLDIIEDTEDRTSMMQRINGIESHYDDWHFYDEVSEITNGLFDTASDAIVMEYPTGAKTFCEIFCNYLQPVLRENLKGLT